MRRRPDPRRVLLALLVLAPSAMAAAEPKKKPPAEAPLLLLEDFEATAAGQIPKGYTKSGAAGVDDQVAHRGAHSLRLDAAANGARCITVGAGPLLTALGGSHWGRLFFKVQLPVAKPQGEGAYPVIHSTLVGGTAQSPQFADAIEVRMLGMVLGPHDLFSYLYNVQPRKRPEFAAGSKAEYRYSDAWVLAEWHVDFASQAYQLFIDGAEIPGAALANGAGNFEKAEIPAVFETLSFGWTNYQKADPGFVAWIDDIALSKDRVGQRGLPPEPKAKRAKAPEPGK